MSRALKHAPLLFPVALLAFVIVRACEHAKETLSIPCAFSTYLDQLFCKPWYAIAYLLVMLVPMAWSLSLYQRRRAQSAAPDIADILFFHVSALILVQGGVFAALVAFGATSLPALIVTETLVFFVGLAIFSFGRRRPPLEERSGLAMAALTYVAMVGILSATGLYSVRLGQDFSCDLQAYHYYNAYSFLNGRLHFDYAIADLCTYFNPLADVPLYLMVKHLRPIWVGLTQGALHALPAILLFCVAYKVLAQGALTRRYRLPLALIAAVTGFYEPVCLLEMGLSANDNLLTGLILASLFLVLKAASEPTSPAGRRLILCLSGVLMGAAVAFKLTLASFGVAAVVAIAVTVRGARGGLALTAWFAAAAATGFALVEGPWALALDREFGSLLFPFFNSWFHSPYAQPFSLQITSQVPATWSEAVFYPFYFLQPQMKALEGTNFQDVRLALAYTLLAVLLLTKMIGAWRRRGLGASTVPLSPKLAPSARFVLVFCVVGYIVWHVQFHILRYLCPVMMLAPLLIILVLAWLLSGERRILWASALAGIVIVGCTEVGSFGRVLWATSVLDAKVPKIEDAAHAILLTSWEVEAPQTVISPIGFVVPAFPPGMRCIRLDASLMEARLEMHREVRQILADQSGPMYILAHRHGLGLASARLRDFGLWVAKEEWQPVTCFAHELRVWRVYRGPEPATAASGRHAFAAPE